MNNEKLAKIKQRIESMRLQAANLKTSDLVSLAVSLGGNKRKGGKHLIYINQFQGLRSVRITNHPG